MKTKLLVGAVAALLYGGVALAGNKDCPPGYEKKDTQASVDAQVGDESLTIVETEPVEEAIGGAGQVGQEQDLTMDEQSSMDEELGIGGSGTGDIILRCQPVRSGTGGSGYQTEPLREPPVTQPVEPVTPPSGAFIPITEDEDVTVRRESKADMRGLTLMVGGGVEGYTGALAPEINPGPAYGVTASIKPSKVLGIELGYSGAVNNLDPSVGDLSGTSGPDIVRNGGQAALTFGLGAAPVQPYLLGGIGFSDYNVRGAGAAAAGYSDDMVGNVPVGAGLRTHIGNFTADLRANYNFLFDQDFAGVDTGFNENGRYSGTLNIGGTF